MGWGLGGVCGCCSPCSAPRPFSFCVSPVNQTLQALGSTVTQEQGVLEQSSAVLPLSPAPFAFLVSLSPVQGKKTSANHPFWGHTPKWQRVPSSSTGRHLQSPQGTEPGSAQVTRRREEVLSPCWGCPGLLGLPTRPPQQPKGCGQGVHCENPFSPSLISPLHNSPTELLGNSSSLLADLLYFSKSNNEKCIN